MKKIINGKVYDTATATSLGDWSYGLPGDFTYIEETLYRKRTGEYFLHGEGGPRTRYSEALGDNTWAGGKKITPLTVEAARAWAEEHLDGDEYEAIFGEIAEDDTRQAINLNLPASLIEASRRAAAQKGISLSAWVEGLAAAALAETV